MDKKSNGTKDKIKGRVSFDVFDITQPNLVPENSQFYKEFFELMYGGSNGILFIGPNTKQVIEELLYCLPEKLNAIVKMRCGYEDGQPLSNYDIGKKYNVTRERIRQLLEKAGRRLRYQEKHQESAKKMMDEIMELDIPVDDRDLFLENYIEIRKKSGENLSAEDRARLLEIYENGQKKKKVLSNDKKTDKTEVDVETELADDVAVEELNVGVRGFNCLKRVGVNNMSDLIGYSIEELMQIRNIRPKDVMEIVKRVHALGFLFKGEGPTENKIPENNVVDRKLNSLIGQMRASYSTSMQVKQENRVAQEELKRVKEKSKVQKAQFERV